MTNVLPLRVATLFCVTLAAAFPLADCVVASERSPVQDAITEAAADGRFAFVLFHRGRNAETESAHRTLRAEASKHDAAVLPVDVRNDREAALVDRFDATRLPMPAAVAIAPNGAVTGVFPLRVTAEKIRGTIVSPGYAECIKHMQDGKLVLLCVHPGDVGGVPEGVKQFAADPHFRDRTRLVHVSADDARETSFVKRLEIRTDGASPAVLFMAPPGVMVGKFDAGVTVTTLAAKLSDAGKCCKDPNCKHRSAGQSKKTNRR